MPGSEDPLFALLEMFLCVEAGLRCRNRDASYRLWWVFCFIPRLGRVLNKQIGFAASSYAGKTTESRGARLEYAILPDLCNCDVLIVDDILDTGGTLRIVQDLVRSGRPRSVRTAVLLRKREVAPANLPVDFVGFDIEDEFVIGYGLDYDGLFRNLPYIGVLKSDFHERERASR